MKTALLLTLFFLPIVLYSQQSSVWNRVPAPPGLLTQSYGITYRVAPDGEIYIQDDYLYHSPASEINWSTTPAIPGMLLETFALDSTGNIIASVHSPSTPSVSYFYRFDQTGTWKNLPNTPQENFRQIEVGSDNTYYGFTQSQKLYKSEDMGTTWELIETERVSFYSLAVLPNGALLVHTPTGVQRSTDKGQQWQPVNVDTLHHPPLYTYFIRYAHIDSVSFALSNPGFLMKSVDGGLNWQRMELETELETDTLFASIGTGAGGSLFVQTADYRLYRSDNLGNSWKYLGDDFLHGLAGYARISDQRTMAFGIGGPYISDNKGETWTRATENSRDPYVPYGIRSLAVRGGNEVMVASSFGIVSTTDQGSTWKTYDATGYASISLHLLKDSSVIGLQDNILLLLEPGSSKLVTKSLQGYLPRDKFVVTGTKDSFIIAYTQSNGDVRVSSDMGKTWHVSRPDSSSDGTIRDLALDANDNLYLVSGGKLYRIPIEALLGDSAPEWEAVSIPATASYQVACYGTDFVAFSNGTIADGSTVYLSTDGGESWSESPLIKKSFILDLYIDQDTTVYAVTHTDGQPNAVYGLYFKQQTSDDWVQNDYGIQSGAGLLNNLVFTENREAYLGSAYGGLYVRDLPSHVSTGTSERIASTLSVVPNPTSERATLSFVSSQSGHYRVNVYNMLGEVVYSSPLTYHPKGKYDMTVDISSLSPGSYQCEVHSPETGEKYSSTLRVVR